jgi:DNA-directed RNA polymerase subunit RPC12/RpoP
MPKKKEDYKMVYLCINCGHAHYVFLPFGLPAPTTPPLKECEYCGCTYFSHPFHPDDRRVKDAG